MIEPLFKDTLRKHNLYVTHERLVLFRKLEEMQSPCSSTELVETLHGSMDAATVYRNIELFEKIGVIQRVYSGWKYRLELSDQFSSHHHHLTCSNCFGILSFEESRNFVLELDKIAAANNFILKSHSLELRGLCSSCA